MAVGGLILLGGLLLSLSNLAPVDDKVVLVDHTVDLDGAEGETLEVHRSPLAGAYSRLPDQAERWADRQRAAFPATGRGLAGY
jgi:hypothetical protein